MRSETFTGKDAADVREQVWTWRKKHPQFFVIKQHPIEGIVPDLNPLRPGQKLEAKKPVSMRVDYQD